LHLFDVENPAPGELSYKESDCFAAGSEPTVVDTGAELICYPSAFNMSTGSLFWELEQQARQGN
ncbi:carbon-nitrogen hydrolase, partial [Tanacetum coccineum]